jgi:glutathione S-transferase
MLQRAKNELFALEERHEGVRWAALSVASLLRLGNGSVVGKQKRKPERRLVLYDQEGSARGWNVREALSLLDLDVDVRPCPRGGQAHAEELRNYVHVQDNVPVLLDPNTTEVFSDPDDIVAYLFRTYGDGKIPWTLRSGRFTKATSEAANWLLAGAGKNLRPAVRPALPLELWGYEPLPGCRRVRSLLTELETPYVLHNAARKSPKRIALWRRVGSVRMPYMEDPNSDVSLAGAGAIVAYLRHTYGR